MRGCGCACAWVRARAQGRRVGAVGGWVARAHPSQSDTHTQSIRQHTHTCMHAALKPVLKVATLKAPSRSPAPPGRFSSRSGMICGHVGVQVCVRGGRGGGVQHRLGGRACEGVTNSRAGDARLHATHTRTHTNPCARSPLRAPVWRQCPPRTAPCCARRAGGARRRAPPRPARRQS